MRTGLIVLLLGSLALLGCKREYWTIGDWNEPPAIRQTTKPEPHTEPKSEPEPETPAQPPKEIIYVLGVDGMD
jgi:hypothetical protein